MWCFSTGMCYLRFVGLFFLKIFIPPSYLKDLGGETEFLLDSFFLPAVYICHCTVLWLSRFLVKKSTVLFLLHGKLCAFFLLDAFKVFSLPLIISCSTQMCLGVFFFLFILFGFTETLDQCVDVFHQN